MSYFIKLSSDRRKIARMPWADQIKVGIHDDFWEIYEGDPLSLPLASLVAVCQDRPTAVKIKEALAYRDQVFAELARRDASGQIER